MRRVAILLSILLSAAPCFQALAQGTGSGQDSNKKPSATTLTPASNSQPARVSIKLEGSERIRLRNPFGSIVVTGTDGGDTLEATAYVTNPGTGDFKYRLLSTRSAQNLVAIVATVITSAQEQNVKEETKQSVKEETKENVQKRTTEPPQPNPQPMPSTQPPATKPTPQPPAGAQARTRVRPPRPRSDTPEFPYNLRGVGEMRLEVKLPRNAKIELIDSRRYAVVSAGNTTYLTPGRGDVTVTNLDTPVQVVSSGNVQTSKVGAVEVRTRAGSVNVKDIAGLVNISTVTGAIIVKDVAGDVRAISISGTISIECAHGRAEASNTNGVITLTSIGGDVDAATTGGTISFTGLIRDGGRYRLRSMSGTVRMMIQKAPPGFLANISSYQGQIVVDFPLKMELASNTITGDLPQGQSQQPVRRMIGRYGDGGDARITLDSFNGTVQLGRATDEGLLKCP